MTLSRTAGPHRWSPPLAILLLWSTALGAQDAATARPAPRVSADEALRAAAQVYGPPDPSARAECPPQKPGGEIVVCGQLEDPDKHRVQSSSELDPTGAGAKDSVPRAPDVGTVYPGIVVASGCFIPPCPPPMPVLIDLKALPEAPEGSDADLIGRGERPR
jgi:hypothetical protein